MTNPTITVELWEDDEYVVCVNGRPGGRTLSKRDANFVADWLRSSTDTLIVAAPGDERSNATTQ